METPFITLQVAYTSCQGIAMVLMFVCFMQNFAFEAKFGVVWRTITRALPDILHYCFILMVVVLGVTFASIASLGDIISALSSFQGTSHGQLTICVLHKNETELLSASIL